MKSKEYKAKRKEVADLLETFGHEYTHDEFQRIVYKLSGALVVADKPNNRIKIHKTFKMVECEPKERNGNWWGLNGTYIKPPKATINSRCHYNWALVKRILKSISTLKETKIL